MEKDCATCRMLTEPETGCCSGCIDDPERPNYKPRD